ncbi:MAG: hypothetical protein KDA81_08505, partial [Planctomycetaceae bacterium]|nr:hypothetical protein [Planctomycetaceae bacterium]
MFLTSWLAGFKRRVCTPAHRTLSRHGRALQWPSVFRKSAHNRTRRIRSLSGRGVSVVGQHANAERLEDRLCLTIVPGFYGVGMVTSTSEVYQLQVDFDADTLTPYQLGTLMRGASTALPARDDAVRGAATGGEFLCVEDNQAAGSRGLPSILRQTDISVFDSGASLPVTDLGALWMADPGGVGSNLDVRVNALEWSPAVGGQPATLFGAGTVGLASNAAFDTPAVFSIDVATQEATPILDLTGIGESAGDITFDLTGNLYLSLVGGDIVQVSLIPPAPAPGVPMLLDANPPFTVLDLPDGTPDFDALLPYDPGLTLIGIARDGSYYQVDIASQTVTAGGSLRSGSGDVLDGTEEVFGSTISFEEPFAVTISTGTVQEVGVVPKLDQLWYEITATESGPMTIDLTDGDVPGQTWMLLYDSLDATSPISDGPNQVSDVVAAGETRWLHVVGLDHGATADLSFNVSDPLTVIGTTPSLNDGVLPAGTTELTVHFMGQPDPAAGATPFVLHSVGADGLLGSADQLGTSDDIAVFISSATYNGSNVTLTFDPLPESVYRLTIQDTLTGIVGDLLDGDSDGEAGGDWSNDVVALGMSDEPVPYRWQTFNTYDNASGWLMNNDSSLYGGVTPSNWTDSGYRASEMSTNPDVLGALFTNKGYATSNANIWSETETVYSSTNGEIAAALFRVQNQTDADITWTPSFYFSANPGWGERASVAVNGVNIWSSGGAAGLLSSPTVNLS